MNHNLPQWGQATSLVDYEMAPMPEKYLVSPQPGKDFLGSRLVGKLRELRPGCFMALADQFGDIEMADSSLRINAYTIPEMARGREESQRAVKFGQLVMHSKSQGERVELVAIKPMPNQVAAREYHASEAIAESLFDKYDYRTTFTNVGFFRDSITKHVQLVSRYDHAVQSADQIMWNRAEMPSTEQVADVFRKAANTLSDLHGEALVGHGDAQPKNIASDNRGVRIIDLEEAVDFREHGGGLNTIRTPKLIQNDLRWFFSRLGGDYSDLVQPHFTERYLSRLSESELLPGFVQPTEYEIMQIAREPQTAIPYLTNP